MMTTPDKIALASAVLVGVGILVTILMYTLQRRHAQLDQAKIALRALLQKLKETHFFGIDPEQEIWEFGFDSIKGLASLTAAADVAANSRLVPKSVRASVSELHAQVNGIRALHDSWRLVREGKKGDWRSVQKNWLDIQRATSALEVAKPVAARCKQELESFLN